MLELIIAILISLGISAESDTRMYSIDSATANQIQNSKEYESLGGDDEFYHYVTIENKDIVITDDDDPAK
jgi:hypothetical protein